MKKAFKIILIIILVLLVLMLSLAIWQCENINALFMGLKYSSADEIATLMQENDKIVSEALTEYNAGEMTELDDEQKKQLEEGTLSEQDAIDIVLGRKKSDSVLNKGNGRNTSQEKPNVSKPPKTNDEKSNVDEKISEQIAKMYVLKAQYTSSLEGLHSSILAEYDALPKEQRTKSAKEALGKKALGIAAGMESECDASVNAVISELKSILSSSGRDMSLVSSIQSAYNNEKKLKKAYYVNLYVK